MNKLLNILGLSMRAGKVVSGEQGVEIAIKSKKAYLVIISSDASNILLKSSELHVNIIKYLLL